MRRKKSEEDDSTLSSNELDAVTEPAPEKAEKPKPKTVAGGIRVTEYATSRSEGDRIVLMAAFERWCQDDGYGKKKLTAGEWDELLETFKNSEV